MNLSLISHSNQRDNGTKRLFLVEDNFIIAMDKPGIGKEGLF